MAGTTWDTMVISTPNGEFGVAQGLKMDGQVKDELRKAAKWAGMSNFYGFVNGDQITPDSNVSTQKISDLKNLPRIENVEPISVRPYNKAG